MVDSNWRTRLQTAIDESGYSLREVSLKAGKGPGYMFSILKEGKDPTVNSMAAVCDALNVSAAWILLGVEMSRQTEEIVKRLGESEEDQALMLKLLKKRELPQTL